MAVSLRETHGRLCVLWSSTLFHKCFTFTMNFAGGRLASAPVSLYSCDFGTSVRHITSVPILYHHFLFKQKKVHGRSSSVHQRYRQYTKGWNEKVWLTHRPGRPAGAAGLPSQSDDHTFSPRLLPKLLQRQHNLRHKHPRLILSVNVPAILFNHQIDPF